MPLGKFKNTDKQKIKNSKQRAAHTTETRKILKEHRHFLSLLFILEKFETNIQEFHLHSKWQEGQLKRKKSPTVAKLFILKENGSLMCFI